MNVPLAEHFHSIQGEGAHTGLPMHFLRLPGCSVGREQKGVDTLDGKSDTAFVVLPNEAVAKVCRTFNGTEFFCDTDYEKHEELTLDQLLAETWESAFCLTGGEPLLHQKQEWFQELVKKAKQEIHVETSGTVLPLYEFDWLTISPKYGWRPEAIAKADQLKFLVTEWTNIADIFKVARHASDGCEVYLSPVFDPNRLVEVNLQKCFEIQNLMPQWKLGCQWHKFLGLR